MYRTVLFDESLESGACPQKHRMLGNHPMLAAL